MHSLRRIVHVLFSIALCAGATVVATRSASAADSLAPAAETEAKDDLVDARVGAGVALLGFGWAVADAQVAIWARPWGRGQPAFALGVIAQGGGSDAQPLFGRGCDHWCAASLRRIGGLARLHFLPREVFDPWVGIELTAARMELSYPVTQGPHDYPDAAALIGFDVHLSVVRFGVHAQYTRPLQSDAFPVVAGHAPVDATVEGAYPELGLHLGASF